jgi:peptide/nickel transport system permease protein
MTVVICRKAFRAMLTVLLVVTFAFVFLRASGDPSAATLGPDASRQAIDAFRARWSLDTPLHQQYLAYLAGALRGDFGVSFIGGRSARSVVMERVPQTLVLMGTALVISLMLGLVAGIGAALCRDRWLDRVLIGVAAMGFCLPDFLTGILLILIFGATLQILPISGNESLLHYVMPTISLALANTAMLARFTRSSMLEVLNQPYMRAARARGVPWPLAVRRHALPNAAIPLVTIAGLLAGSLIVGATVTETVFAWPGVGQLLVSSVESRDLAVVQTIVILAGVSMVAANLIVDLLYLWLDPRLRSAQ